jgi:septum formation protein
VLPLFDSIILASASPRRRELLEQIGVRYQVQAHAVDETPGNGEAPEDYVCRLALAKARSIAHSSSQNSRTPVLGADTIVVCGSQILGKPTDRRDAIKMLKMLSGRTHSVYSAVALYLGDEHALRMSTTKVTFRILSAAECERYWETGEPEGKAGAYAIQGFGAIFVSAIVGSFSGVVGLPIYETCQLFDHFDVVTGLSRFERDEKTA